MVTKSNFAKAKKRKVFKKDRLTMLCKNWYLYHSIGKIKQWEQNNQRKTDMQSTDFTIISIKYSLHVQ